jgi:hypothetical protein
MKRETRETEEQRRARYLQAHKDDEELWGEARIRELAQEGGLAYSEIVRNAVNAFIHPRTQYEMGQGNYLFEVSPYRTGLVSSQPSTFPVQDVMSRTGLLAAPAA